MLAYTTLTYIDISIEIYSQRTMNRLGMDRHELFSSLGRYRKGNAREKMIEGGSQIQSGC